MRLLIQIQTLLGGTVIEFQLHKETKHVAEKTYLQDTAVNLKRSLQIHGSVMKICTHVVLYLYRGWNNNLTKYQE